MRLKRFVGNHMKRTAPFGIGLTLLIFIFSLGACHRQDAPVLHLASTSDAPTANSGVANNGPITGTSGANWKLSLAGSSKRSRSTSICSARDVS